MRKIAVIAVVLLFFSPGCFDSDEIDESNEQIMEEVIEENKEIIDNKGNETEEIVFEPEFVEVPHEEGCDNINPLHCMFPFPSSAFLTSDSTKIVDAILSTSFSLN